jgi:uncharacterized membrane protein YeaQ/YmgE (transglycosylase-associated protein family)
MSGALILGWALVGWCATPWRKWPPPPPPDPWWWIVNVVGVVGGILGGWLFGQLFAVDLAESAGILLTMVGAVAGSIIANDVAGMAMRGRSVG